MVSLFKNDRWLIFISISIIFTSSCTYVTSTKYLFDSGKHWRKEGKSLRYFGIQEKEYYIYVLVHDSTLGIWRFTYEDIGKKNLLVTDDISQIKFLDFKVSFLEDSANVKNAKRIPLKEIKPYYTCPDFKNMITNHKYISLTIKYRQDSSGYVRDFQKEYNLVKQVSKGFRFSVH